MEMWVDGVVGLFSRCLVHLMAMEEGDSLTYVIRMGLAALEALVCGDWSKTVLFTEVADPLISCRIMCGIQFYLLH